VVIDDGSGCTGTTSFFVQQSPDETPSVTANGPTTICEGGSVELSSSVANGYAWSNGATTQQTSISQSGTYTVTITGTCGEFTSAPIDVEVLAAPMPVADDVILSGPGSATLEAIGDNIQWFAENSGGPAIASGNTFITPFLNSTTTFYASATTIHGGGDWFGGPEDRLTTAAPGAYHTNSDNYPVFTASEAFTIVSVKVYANGAGNRTVALIDRADGSTIASQVINIPDGESRIDLNYAVPGPGEYGLRCVGGNPQLWRDGNGSNPAYPYPLGTVGAITTSSVTGANALNFYYFFYDWEVEAAGVSCESLRDPATVEISVGIAENGEAPIGVFPNPAHESITVVATGVAGLTSIELLDVTGRVALSQGASSTGISTIGLQGVAPGEYIVRVQHALGTSHQRVVVQ
jgi:hypothetical protein